MHNLQTAEEAPQTAEAKAKDLGARIEFHKTCIVAKFHEREKHEIFSQWLNGRDCYHIIDTGPSSMCVAYAARSALSKSSP